MARAQADLKDRAAGHTTAKYNSVADVERDHASGKLSDAQAKKVLIDQFGYTAKQ